MAKKTTGLILFLMLVLVGCTAKADIGCVPQPANDFCSYFTANSTQYLCSSNIVLGDGCLELAALPPDTNGNVVWCCNLQPMCRFAGDSPPCGSPNQQLHNPVGYDCIFGAVPSVAGCYLQSNVSNYESIYCCNN